MKRAVVILLVLLILAAAAIGWTFTPAKLDAGESPLSADAPAKPLNEVAVSVLHTGTMEARAAFTFRGGSFTDKRSFVMPALVIQHPESTLLIDAGLGINALQHLDGEPWLLRALSNANPSQPAARQLDGIAIDAIVITHAHWDHVSGIQDFPKVPVLTTKEEIDFMESGHEASRLAREIFAERKAKPVPIDFGDGPFQGFASSHDYFGDGSVVMVPAPGHTPGSIWVFASTGSQGRLLLVGDAVWQHEGYELPAERPWIARRKVDYNAEMARKNVRLLHHLAKTGQWHILPAHDEKAWSTIPSYGPGA